MDFQIDAIQARVLGSLVEKDLATPEYYPLSLNALVNACNQKNNRDPVMSLDEAAVEEALESLRAKGLTTRISGPGLRVEKYGHRLSERFNFDRRELAVLCVLLLRGPQTLGELRGRSERMYSFDGLEGVEATLRRLAGREDGPWVARLPHAPGTKEPRHAHLLSGAVERLEAAAAVAPAPESPAGGRLERLEAEVAELREAVRGLGEQFAAFRRQFE